MVLPSQRNLRGSIDRRDDEVLFLESKDFSEYGYSVLDARYFASIFEPDFTSPHVDHSAVTV